MLILTSTVLRYVFSSTYLILKYNNDDYCYMFYVNFVVCYYCNCVAKISVNI